MTVTRPRELATVKMNRESWERVATALSRAGFRQELADVFVATAIDPSRHHLVRESDHVSSTLARALPRTEVMS